MRKIDFDIAESNKHDKLSYKNDKTKKIVIRKKLLKQNVTSQIQMLEEMTCVFFLRTVNCSGCFQLVPLTVGIKRSFFGLLL